DSKQAGLMVQERLDLIRGMVAEKIEDNARVEAAAACGHAEAVEGGEAHGGIDAAAGLHGTEAGAAAQVGDDDAAGGSVRRDRVELAGDGFVGKAVEAPALDAALKE